MPKKTCFSDWESVARCDLCETTSILDLHQGDQVQISKCQACGYIFTNPRPTLAEIAESYSQDDFYDGWLKEDDGRAEMWEKRAKRATAHNLPGKTVFDYSAGIGTFLQLLKSKGYEVFGTEISASAKRIALSKHGIQLGSDADFSGGDFDARIDLITAWHVVEHVHSPRTLIQWFHRLLKPGGVLVIAVPNLYARPLRRFFSKGIDEQSVFWPMKPGTELHLSHFSHDTMKEFLTREGFDIEVDSIDDCYPVKSWKNRLRFWLTKATFSLTGFDRSPAMYIAARRR